MGALVVLLRGVNVGGHRKVPMAELRQLLGAAGFGRVRTFIQSGNIVVDTEDSPDEAAGRIKAAIAERFGFEVAVIVRTAAEMDRVASADPFAGRGLDPAKVTVTFLEAAAPEPLQVPAGCPEEAVTAGAEVWVYYPDGMGRSRLDRTAFWKPLGAMQATTRNFRTVVKLRDLAAE